MESVSAGIWKAAAGLVAALVLVAPVGADEATTVARLEKLQGVVERDPKLPGNPVVQVSLQATSATDADLAMLRELKHLKRLYLGYGTRTTDAGLAHLGKIPTLEVLQLPETAVTDAGLAHLKPLTRLQKLGLLNCKRITDAGLVHLRGLQSLRDVSVYGTEVTERGVADLQKYLPKAYIAGGRRVVPPGYPTQAQRKARIKAATPGLPEEVLDFLSLYDGTERGAETALARYQAPEADVLDLVAIMLEEPQVTKIQRNGPLTCYTVEAKQGILAGTYRVCWKAGKIQSAKRLSLK